MANTINLQTFADDVAGITGPEHVRTEGGVLITTPANTEQIAAILRVFSLMGRDAVPV